MIRGTLDDAALSPNDINYIEGHGTGTPLGDPIEIDALAGVFSHSRPAESRLIVGSVKSNFGHLECAAGVSGLIKTVLMLQKGSVPPNSALKNLNPLIQETIDSSDFPVFFPVKTELLTEVFGSSEPFFAGVSSFGYGGTIAHAVLC